jgi:hypothetical protein
MNEPARGERTPIMDRTVAMVLPVVDRLRLVVEAENQEIAGKGRVDYPAYSLRKSQGLLELNRLRPALASITGHPTARAALADLQAKLDLNSRLLQVQLKAARTVSDIVARAIRDGQSDGTYSAFHWRDDEE